MLDTHSCARITSGAIPQCQQRFFYRTHFRCMFGGTQHFKTVLGVDRGQLKDKAYNTEAVYLSKDCADFMAAKILLTYSDEEKEVFYYSCSLCGQSDDPKWPTNNRTTSSLMCLCEEGSQPLLTWHLRDSRSS